MLPLYDEGRMQAVLRPAACILTQELADFRLFLPGGGTLPLSEVVEIQVLGGGQDLRRIHAPDQIGAHLIGDQEQDLAVHALVH